MIYVMPTIDVEAAHGSAPFEQLIEGRIGTTDDWGVYRQARLFQSFGVSAVFFVDVYEALLWGEQRFAELCQKLDEMGQDVQLHTHPSWRTDPRDNKSLQAYKRSRCQFPPERDFMAKLTQREQIEFLERGIHYFQRWLGRKPIAHRSGGYSINNDTIEALAHTGIRLDSSMHPACKNTKANWGLNRIEKKRGVIQFPVTVMNLQVTPAAHGFAKQNLLKTDIDSVSHRDMIAFLRQSLRKNVRIMNLFMHSYSLLEMNGDFSILRPSPRKLKYLSETLRFCSEEPRVQFVNAGQFLEAYDADPHRFAGPDSIPTVWSPGTFSRLAYRKIRRHFFPPNAA
ncbi:MAG: hypothetical protein WD049_04570 [Candidatus Paceibacterota bacterium]